MLYLTTGWLTNIYLEMYSPTRWLSMKTFRGWSPNVLPKFTFEWHLLSWAILPLIPPPCLPISQHTSPSWSTRCVSSCALFPSASLTRPNNSALSSSPAKARSRLLGLLFASWSRNHWLTGALSTQSSASRTTTSYFTTLSNTLLEVWHLMIFEILYFPRIFLWQDLNDIVPVIVWLSCSDKSILLVPWTIKWNVCNSHFCQQFYRKCLIYRLWICWLELSGVRYREPLCRVCRSELWISFCLPFDVIDTCISRTNKQRRRLCPLLLLSHLKLLVYVYITCALEFSKESTSRRSTRATRVRRSSASGSRTTCISGESSCRRAALTTWEAARRRSTWGPSRRSSSDSCDTCSTSPSYALSFCSHSLIRLY